MFKITITASLSSKPHLERAAGILQQHGVKRVRLDQYDSRYRHPRRTETLAGARLRFVVETTDELKRMIEAAGLEGFGLTNVRKKLDDSDEEDDS